jgi:MraZ protein
MPVFFGEHDLAIDDKNRLLIPAQIRKKIDPEVDGRSLFVTLKRNNHGMIPWFYPEAFFMGLVKQGAPAVLAPDEQQLKFTYETLSIADELEWDNQGRVVLSEKILGRANLGKEVTLVGANEHLELWNRTAWVAFRESGFKTEPRALDR